LRGTVPAKSLSDLDLPFDEAWRALLSVHVTALSPSTPQTFITETPAPSGGRVIMTISQPTPALRSDVTLIEFDSEAVGLAVQDPSGFRFYSATPSLNRLDSQLFHSLKALRQAVADMRRGRSGRLSGTRPPVPVAA
jgi:hypothetical protein